MSRRTLTQRVVALEGKVRRLQKAQVFKIVAPAAQKALEACRFIKLGADGKPYPALITDKHVAVHDRLTGLTWSRGFPTKKKLPWKQACEAATAFTLPGFGPFRAQMPGERTTITDFSRHNPALDTDLFDAPDNGWEWTGQVYTPSPSDYAWFVSVGSGGVDWSYQYGGGWVRAVCGPAGQSLGTGGIA